MWGTYTIGRRFEKYEDGLISELVTKYNSQPPEYRDVPFYKPNITDEILMAGNTALVTLWDSVLSEVSEGLIQSCDLHTFIDEYMQINYG